MRGKLAENHRHLKVQQLKECLAKAISERCSPSKLRCVHARAVSSGLQLNLFISSLLITKYFTFGDPQAARLLFDSLPIRRAKPLIWNSLISGYLRCGSPRLALDVFREMTVGSFLECEPDRHTFHLAVSACTRLSEFELGFMIGDRARARGVHSDLLVSTALIDMYEKAGDLDSARLVFDEMAVKDAVSWNAMISGSLRAGRFSEAVELFRKMNLCGLRMTEGSLVSVISLCSDMAWFWNGEALHARVIVTGFDGYQFVLNSLLEMYGQFSRLDAAVKLFDRMAVKDSVSWSTMIGGYFKNGHPFEALKIFRWLILNAGILPTRPMLLNALLACASLGDWQTGKWIGKYLSESSDEIAFDSTLKTTLIYMYAKCRKMEITLDLLESDTRVKGDVIAWNAVIKACVETGEFHQGKAFMLNLDNKASPSWLHFFVAPSLMASAVVLGSTLNLSLNPPYRGRRQNQFDVSAIVRRSRRPWGFPSLVLARRRKTSFSRAAQGDGGSVEINQSPPAIRTDTEEVNNSASSGDGYVALLVQTLGLHNDPLDREQAVITLWKYSDGGKECVDSIMKYPGCAKVQGLCTLWNLSIEEKTRIKIGHGDLLPLLIKFLDDEAINIKEAAVGIMANLTLSPSYHIAMVEAGAIGKLADLFKCNAKDFKVIRKAAKMALLELSKDDYYRVLIFEEGLIRVPLVGAAAYKSFRPQLHSRPTLPDGTEFELTSRPSKFGATELLLGLSFREKNFNLKSQRVMPSLHNLSSIFLHKLVLSRLRIKEALN
ncbi:hypothetical protein HPP92_024203 [Vanilla planifolia]|uniref:Protein unc-45 homolog B n=1 Tax=Vanilla planifolia TaxID=51239 RepID=A0A835UCR2_VANPL|nr:hypothetical protein HPP92_024203 [Vanilla planifolia]